MLIPPLDRSFVVAERSWPVATAAQVVRAIFPRNGRVLLADAGGRYAVIPAREVIAAARTSGNLTMESTFGGRPTRPAFRREELHEAGSELVVVVEDRVPIGLFQGGSPLNVSRRTPVELAGGKLRLRGPSSLPAGQETTFELAIEIRGAQSHRAQDVGIELDVRGAVTRARLVDDRHAIALFAASAGAGTLTIRITIAGEPVAKDTVLLQVMPPGDRPAVVHDVDIGLLEVGTPPPLSMLVSDADGRFRIDLVTAEGLAIGAYGPVAFPGGLLQQLSDDLVRLDRHIHDPEAERLLAPWADGLSGALMPAELRRDLWELRERIDSLHVISDDHRIPWELCRLSGPGRDGKIVASDFLCAHMAMTRWPRGELRPPLRLLLHRLALVVPSGAQLPGAAEEGRDLFELFPAVDRVPAALVELHGALASGEHDAWHFAGHGLYDASDAAAPSLVLDHDLRFRPYHLSGVVANLGQRAPVVVLNACHTDPVGLPTGIDSWSRPFLAAGAGAFVGTRWRVLDEQARWFSRHLYRELQNGQPFGQAVRAARLAIRSHGLTWLAYAAFGHPLARRVDAAAQGDFASSGDPT